MPPVGAEPGKETNWDQRGALEEVQDVLEEIRRCSGVDVVLILSRPASPLVVPRREISVQTDINETSAMIAISQDLYAMGRENPTR
jgi:hypothetical protein